MTGKIISYSPDRGKVLSGRTIPTTYFALSVSIRVQSLSHGFLLRDSTLNMTLWSVDFPKQPASDCLMCNRDRRRNILETKREWADRLGWGFAHCDEPDSNGKSQRIFVHFSDIK